MLMQNVYQFLIKALEERPAQEEGQNEENVLHVHVVAKTSKKNVDFGNYLKLKQGFSMADLFGDIEL